MLLLVSGANYFVMFVGWEGKIECLKWCEIENINCSVLYLNTLNKFTSTQRIGPHNIDILSIIIGSSLGDTHLERRKKGLGTRVIFEQSNKNVEYLM